MHSVTALEVVDRPFWGDVATRALLDIMSEAVTLAGEDGVIRYANPAAARLFGYAEGELIGLSMADLNGYPEEERLRLDAAVVAEIASNGVWSGVWLNRRKDGAPFLTAARLTRPMCEGQRCWMLLNSDLMAVEGLQQALQDDHIRLELATRAAELGVWDWNLLDGSFIYSPRAKAICGLPQDGEPTLADIVAITHPGDYVITRAQAERAFDPAIRDTQPYEYRIIKPDGDVRWVIAHGHVVFGLIDGAERAIRYVGTLQDVTHRKQLESRLAEKDAVLRSVLDAAQLYIGVAELTPTGYRYVLVNEATAQLYGRHADEQFDASEVNLRPEQIAEWRATFADVIAGGAQRTMEYPSLRDGKIVGWYLGTFTPLPPGPNGAPRVSFVVIDITEAKLAGERQKLLMREVDHRAKNALAVVQAVVHLTKEEDPDAFRKAVQGRVAAIARAHGLLAADRWNGADLHRLLADELAPYKTDRPARLRLEGPQHSLAPAFAQSMALVIHELTTNAAKHGALARPAGDLVVRWSVDASGALDMEWRELSDRALTAPPATRGFGLTLLEQTIERQLGGRWSMQWTPQGLRCELYIPAASNAGRRTAATKPAAPRRRRALIVEDEPLIALELEEYLTALGFFVIGRVSTTAEAQRIVDSEGGVDLAVLDVNLGGENTLDLAARLKGAGAGIVFCTGYEGLDPPPHLADSQVLVKPVGKDALAQAIAQVAA